MRALSALLAAAILLAAPTPSAPVAVSQQSTKTQQVQQAPKEEETQKPPIPDPAKSTLPIKADPEEPQPTAQKEATAVKTDACKSGSLIGTAGGAYHRTGCGG